MKDKLDDPRITVRLHLEDDKQCRALEILQERSRQLGKTYGESITEAVLAHFDAPRLSDNELIDKIMERLREELKELQLTSLRKEGDDEPGKVNNSEADGQTSEDEEEFHIDWDFLGD